MTLARGLLGAFSLSVMVSATAAAQTVATFPAVPFAPSASGGWTVSVGLGGQMQPSYPGADRQTFTAFPMFAMRRSGSALVFRGMRDNASIALIDQGGFRAGPTGSFRRARKSGDYRETWGLRDVDYAIEIGGFAEYYPVNWLRGRAEVRRGFNGHEGVIAELSADVIMPLSPQLVFAAGPRYTYTSDRAAQAYFNVSLPESIASGLPAYSTSGSSAVGAGGQLRYTINRQWDVLGWVEYDRLLGSVANSPLVALRGSRDQVKYGLGANYSFDIGIR